MMQTELKRPTSIEELGDCLSRFSTDEGRRTGLAYCADPSDIFVATYPKCGTTWVQQLVHCLRTGGDMEFREITDVVPWLEMSHDLGVDNNTPQKAKPQCFKSHLSWNDIPKGGRYIHITRNPESVLLSFYNFFAGWFFEHGSIDLETFSRHLFLKGTNSGLYWNHINEWWVNRHRQDVLFLCYEHMLDDQKHLVKTVARFIDIELDDELLEITLEKSSATFMRQHVSQFDDHPLRQKRDAICGLPEGGNSSKISVPDEIRVKPVLSEITRQELTRAWQQIVTPETGLDNYDSLLREINST